MGNSLATSSSALLLFNKFKTELLVKSWTDRDSCLLAYPALGLTETAFDSCLETLLKSSKLQVRAKGGPAGWWGQDLRSSPPKA